MILLENKYELFKKVTYDKKKEELEEHYQKLYSKLQEDFDNFKEEKENLFDLQVAKKERDITKEINEKIQIQENKSREEILKFRERMIEDINKDILEKYKSYVSDESYAVSLKENVMPFYNNPDFVIGLTSNDAKRLSLDESKIKILKDDVIGGYTLENIRENSIEDNTISEFVKNNRKTIGFIIQDFINKVGGKVDGE
ncbi:hypothetical protein [Lagierella massiliensis]|uniref:hypothetical protein n=1 Tax=Lagierella massiliensis TaxID=1689303 RepID=UPI0006D854EC|nr:hypothetical protein [Lagierella massiliensis]